MNRFLTLEEKHPKLVQVGFFWILSGLVALTVFLWSPPAGAVRGHLDRATATFLVVDGQILEVTKVTRLLPAGHPLASRNLYQLREPQIHALPAYDFRRLRSVVRVRVWDHQGVARVVQPLEIVQ